MPQQQPPIRMDADLAQQIGYKAGQQVHLFGLEYLALTSLASQRYVQDGIPMTLFCWYKDGFVEGYRSSEEERKSNG